ncbi:MAG TPA: inositol monophosphatase family protein [Actinomycetota bacterium]|nr:inositol monophosphatase family protein [Actinomycetota bacterium]
MYESELAFANELADLAAETALGFFRSELLEVRRKPDTSFVTQADTEVERLAREAIAATFPDDEILGEEEGGSHAPVGRRWILDPIDSTANFARGIQAWATLIALQVDGIGVVGVVNAPAMGERYEAVRHEGARLNGQPIRVSAVDEVRDAHVLLQEMDTLFAGPYAAQTLALVQDCWRPRGFGDWWSHMLVARGSAEVMLEPKLATWDLAAPQVVVEEAGGRCTTFEGGPLGHDNSMLVTNGLLHDEILRRLATR